MMEKFTQEQTKAGRLIRGLGLLLIMTTSVVAASGQTTVEEKLAALEGRIQQLENELAAARGTPPLESRVAEVEQSVAEMEEKADFEGLSFFKGVRFSGLLDSYYGYDFNKPATQVPDFRVFDSSHNSIALNLLELDISKPVSESSPLGYQVTFGYGPAADVVNSFDPLANTTTAANFMQYYLSGRVPVGNGLTIDVGKFVTQHGAEVIESGPNWNYSRGILFGFAIPFYHFGIRATYPVSDSLSTSFFLVNGWNNVVDNNGGKTYGVQFAWAPNDRFSYVQNYMIGPEQDGNDDNFRSLVDSILTVQLHDKVTFLANFDYGRESNTNASPVHWIGGATYLHFQLTDRFALTPRFEFFNDPQGFATGTRQQLKEITITPEFLVNEHMITRFEYRRDWSNSVTFLRGAESIGSSQDTATVGVILNF